MEINKIPAKELKIRMNRFTSMMDTDYPEWEMCALVGAMSMYYLTGTIADGVLLIEREKGAVLWVRRSYERSALESNFGDIRQMVSFRDVRSGYETLPSVIHLDMAQASLEWYGFFNKYMQFTSAKPVDSTMLRARAVKTSYEIELMIKAGKIYDELTTTVVPQYFYDDMSEAELGGNLYGLFIRCGYHGVSRFSMKNADVQLGHIGFGVSSLYPSVFNGASGLMGICPASPVLGSAKRKLANGDLIYIDLGFGIEGMNVDKTIVYSFGRPQSDEVNAAHEHCLYLEEKAAEMLTAGAKPSDIYFKVLDMVKPAYKDSFMGSRGRNVPFLGHGVGLYVDEHPVLARGFDAPLQAGMTIAIEPKIGIEGVGMVGTENTYLVTSDSAVSLTGGRHSIIEC